MLEIHRFDGGKWGWIVSVPRSEEESLMSVLVDTEIRELVATSNFIEDFDESSLQGASYDLRLGRQYMTRGVVKTLTEEAPTVTISSGEFTVLTTYETLNLPLDIVGHFGLTSYWGMRGIVPLFGPQIDPGFYGILVVPVFNAGDSSVSIPLGEKMFTVEFIRTAVPATYGWSERRGKQMRVPPLHTPLDTKPNLADISNLRDRVSTLENAVGRVETNLTIHKAEIQQTMAETQVKLSSDQRIIENRVSDVLASRNFGLASRSFRMGWWGIVIAFLALILGIISGPWLAKLWSH
jgi:dCTP deaminase